MLHSLRLKSAKFVRASRGTTSFTLEGGDGNDTFYAGTVPGAILAGGPGDDSYIFDPARIAATDHLVPVTVTENTGEGTDTLDFSAYSTGVTVDLSTGYVNTRDYLSLRLINTLPIENVIGSSGDDTLTGNDNWNTLTGGNGNDNLFGDDGDDTADGGPGNDYVAEAPANTAPNVFIASVTPNPLVTDDGTFFVEVLDGQPTQLQLTFGKEDPDGNNTFYTVLEQPDGSSFVNGVFTWNVTNGVADGSYRIHVQVTDDGELAASDDKTWFINVTHATSSPPHVDDYHPQAADASYVLTADQQNLTLTAHGNGNFLYSHTIDPKWTSTSDPGQYDSDPTRSQMNVVVDEDSAEHGDVEYDAQTDKIVFTPEPGYYGHGGFWYQVVDNSGGASNWAFVDVLMLDPPNLTIYNGNGNSARAPVADAIEDTVALLPSQT